MMQATALLSLTAQGRQILLRHPCGRSCPCDCSPGVVCFLALLLEMALRRDADASETQLPQGLAASARGAGRFATAVCRISDIAGYMPGQVTGILVGEVALFLPGYRQAFLFALAYWDTRPIEEPDMEPVVRRPREGFTEALTTNISLLRRKLKTPGLRLEKRTLGEVTRTDVVVCYLEGIASPSLVEEVRRRLDRIRVDAILDAGYVEELMEDTPSSPLPQIEHSERPDKAATALLEGRVVRNGSLNGALLWSDCRLPLIVRFLTGTEHQPRHGGRCPRRVCRCSA
ncbi:MAG: spore germination protein [Bacillota bacterium]